MAENKWVSLFYFTGTSGVIGPYLSLVTLGLRKEWQRWSQTKAMPSVEDFGMSTRYLVPKLLRKYRSPKIVPNFDLDLFEEIWWEHFPLSNLSYCEKVPDGTFLEASLWRTRESDLFIATTRKNHWIISRIMTFCSRTDLTLPKRPWQWMLGKLTFLLGPSAYFQGCLCEF